MKNDKELLISTLVALGVEFQTYTDRQFICTDALKKGAVSSIDIRGHVDFNFDKHGKLLGTSTQSVHSFVKSKK